MYEPCLNCGNDSFVKKHYISKTEHNIVACTKCGLVQVNPRDKMLNFSDNEDAPVRWGKLNRLLSMMERDSGLKLREIMEKEFITRRKYFRLKLRDIEKYKTSGKLLDVGCAQGAFLSACSDTDFQLFGVEPSKYTYTEAVKYVPNSTIYNCTLFEVRLLEDNFDVITMIDTLEHLLNPKGTLIEIYRILKPGGLLMIETPNIGHWIPKILRRKWVSFIPHDHVVFFSKSALVNLLNEIGFEVKDIKSSFRIISVRLFLFHLWHYFKMLSRALMKVAESIGFADKTLSIPLLDVMVVFAVKP